MWSTVRGGLAHLVVHVNFVSGLGLDGTFLWTLLDSNLQLLGLSVAPFRAEGDQNDANKDGEQAKLHYDTQRG